MVARAGNAWCPLQRFVYYGAEQTCVEEVCCWRKEAARYTLVSGRDAVALQVLVGASQCKMEAREHREQLMTTNDPPTGKPYRLRHCINPFPSLANIHYKLHEHLQQRALSASLPATHQARLGAMATMQRPRPPGSVCTLLPIAPSMSHASITCSVVPAQAVLAWQPHHFTNPITHMAPGGSAACVLQEQAMPALLS